MKIGEIARQAGVRVDTIRYYERVGVLPPATRRASGYRSFSVAAVERVRFAKRLQSIGFTLEEVAEVLVDVDHGLVGCTVAQRRRVEAVLARVDGQLAALRAVRRRLTTTLSACRAGRCELVRGDS